jgi:hypothetical protein
MIKVLLAIASVIGVGLVSLHAEDLYINKNVVVPRQAEGINIMEDSYTKGGSRIRYESVDTLNNKKTSSLTDRLMIGIGSDKLFGTKMLGGYLEMTDVNARITKYNSTNNGKTEYNEIVDPEQSRLTQSYLNFKPMDGLLIRYGRQALNFDNQRFIGDVGWRQMPQTFNAFLLSIKNNQIGLDVAYITKVNTIFADKKYTDDDVTFNNDQEDNRSIVVHATYKIFDDLKAVGYAHFSEIGTYGYFLTGKSKVSNNLTINYRIEHATQFNNENNKNDDNKSANNTYESNVNYYNLELGINLSGFLANINYERLNSKSGNNEAFSTPLASKHRHNGWADKFLITPEDGLIDKNLMLGYKSKWFGEFKVIYHKFESENSHAKFGSEKDASYRRSLGINGLEGILKYAKYTSEELSVDTRKFWVMINYKFSICDN